jgi:hypothetical protein
VPSGQRGSLKIRCYGLPPSLAVIELGMQPEASGLYAPPSSTAEIVASVKNMLPSVSLHLSEKVCGPAERTPETAVTAMLPPWPGLCVVVASPASTSKVGSKGPTALPSASR